MGTPDEQSTSCVAEARLSEYGRSCTRPSPVSQLMREFSRDFRVGVDINLGVGYVNEDTIPARTIASAFTYVATHPEEYPHAFNYGESKGSERLEAALRRFFVRHAIGGYTARSLSERQFVIGANGATSLLYGLASILPRGVVVTTDPQYYIYSNALRRLGFTLRTVPEEHDGIDVAKLEAVLADCGDDVSFVYVVTIGNPSAAVLSNEKRRRLVELVTRLSRRLGRKVPLILDEAYEWLVHPPHATSPAEPKPQSSGTQSSGAQSSGAQWDELGLVYELGTLSKVLAPSLRIGFALGRPGPLLDALVQSTNDMGFSAPLVNQEACAYLLDHVVDEHVTSVRAGYAAKARLVSEALDTELSVWLESRVGGTAGFYYYLTFKGIRTDSESAFYAFCSRTTGEPTDARAPRVVYLPGNLCVDPDGQNAEEARRQLRLSYGFSEPDELRRGVALLGEAARYAKDEDAGISRRVMADPTLLVFLRHVLRSYERCLGKPLATGADEVELIRSLARAPFVLLSHGNQTEPIYNFGNALALQLWEMSWDEFTALPSHRCAEPMHRAEREAFLAEVARRGFAAGYSGVRISRTGRRFRIEDVTCWNVLDDTGAKIGQAACYPRWTFLEEPPTNASNSLGNSPNVSVR